LSAVTALEDADSRVDPLGDADAARASLFDPEQFVEFKGRRFNSGLGMGPSDGGVRVIVGGKGAGKTIYLRRLQTGLSSNHSLYVDDWRNKPPATRDVLTIWSWSSSVTDCRHRWSQLWRRAIMRSVTSHLLCVKKLRARVPQGTLGRLARDFPELIPQFEGPSSIVSQVGAVIREHRDRDALDNFIHHTRWEVFEQRLIEALEESPPMFFILDALDEEFETAPSQWLDCQEGLLRQVLELRANQRFGARLHVVIGIRDLVYSTTQQGEHASRFHRVPGIKYLRWNGEAIAHFLEEKLRGLDADRWMLKPSAGETVERWLGHEMIYNKKRERWEVLQDYILRHTRLIPRDVIQMGNALCRDIDVVVDGGERVLHEDSIRDTVAEVSRESGIEQLYIVANHITADIMPREALEHGFADTYIELPDEKASPEDVARAFQRAVFKDLRSALGELQEDRITKKRLSDFAASLENLGDVDVLSILWQHRLLGYIDGGKRLEGTPIFYGVAQDDGLELPREHAHYALHPILIDAVPRLKGVGNVVAQS
jgi:hypothetical protein